MYIVEPTSQFKKQYKRLVKKYPHMQEQFKELFIDLENGIFSGDEYSDLGLPEG